MKKTTRDIVETDFSIYIFICSLCITIWIWTHGAVVVTLTSSRDFHRSHTLRTVAYCSMCVDRYGRVCVCARSIASTYLIC